MYNFPLCIEICIKLIPPAQCDATWSSKVYDNFNDYADGKRLSSTTGYGIEVGPEVRAEVTGSGGLTDLVSKKGKGGKKVVVLFSI